MDECERLHLRDLLPSAGHFAFQAPGTNRGIHSWWFRTAWAGWYWVEFNLTQWDLALYPHEPGLTFAVNLRWRGHYKRFERRWLYA